MQPDGSSAEPDVLNPGASGGIGAVRPKSSTLRWVLAVLAGVMAWLVAGVAAVVALGIGLGNASWLGLVIGSVVTGVVARARGRGWVYAVLFTLVGELVFGSVVALLFPRL